MNKNLVDISVYLLISPQIDQWMKDTDLNKDGVVSYDEFKESLRKSISNFF